MEKNNRNLYRYIAGGLLAVSLVLGLAGCFTGAFSFWTAVGLAATALMMAALFTEKYVLLAVGAALRIPNLLVAVFQNGRYAFGYLRYYAPFGLWGPQMLFLLNALLTAIGTGLLVLAVFNRSKAKKLCILSAGLDGAGFLMWATAFCILSNSVGAGLIRNLLTEVLTCAPIVLTGFVLQTGEKKIASKPVAPAVAAADRSDRIEKLMKLKELLDAGVLSREEFDAKKQELLGL